VDAADCFRQQPCDVDDLDFTVSLVRRHLDAVCHHYVIESAIADQPSGLAVELAVDGVCQDSPSATLEYEISCFDRGPEPLAAMLRPGSASPDDAAGHLALLEEAVAQIPASWAREAATQAGAIRLRRRPHKSPNIASPHLPQARVRPDDARRGSLRPCQGAVGPHY
jgi:hypothetical protein